MALMTNLQLKSVVWGGDWVLDLSIPQAEWSHITMTWDVEHSERLIYLNGQVVGTRADSTVPAVRNNLGIGLWIGWPDSWGDDSFTGLLDDVRVYDHILAPKEIAEAMRGTGPGLASAPSPEDKAADVPADVVVTWTPGEFAATHDVYLGTSFADVNDASRADARGVLASQDQGEAAYEPAALAYGQTYYWRVDEVNAAPDYTVYKGEVWSFTAEPYSYPVTPIAATASSAQAGMGPENTINGSGLNDLDEHSAELREMWMSAGTPRPNWIQYEFDRVYKLDELLVWNSNQLIETFLGFGARDVTIEYSADGQTWAQIEGVPEFAKATASHTYRANTTVDLGGAMAKFVKLTINANWGGVAPQTGLSEVRFFYVPLQAREPQPQDGATGVALDTSLNWRPGREAESHEVSFGTDEAAVTAGAGAEIVTEHSYAPASMDFATTYFWKVDEVGAAGSYEGEVWSLTTQEYAPVDDMEGYNDDDNRIYDAWIDGLADPARGGSQVGYDVSPFAERTIVHGGSQSLPLRYNNEQAPFYSEAEREFSPVQSWTIGGADSVRLWVRGVPATNSPADLYLTVEDSAGKTARVTNATAAVSADWTQWRIPQADLAGANLSRVKKVVIGVGNRTSPVKGGAGIVYLDDLGFGRPLP